MKILNSSLHKCLLSLLTETCMYRKCINMLYYYIYMYIIHVHIHTYSNTCTYTHIVIHDTIKKERKKGRHLRQWENEK